MQTETRTSLMQRAGLPASEAACIGQTFAFTYHVEEQETRLVGKIDGLIIEIGVNPSPLRIVSSVLVPGRMSPQLIFWEAQEVYQKGIQPAHWKIVFYPKPERHFADQSEYFEGTLELLL